MKPHISTIILLIGISILSACTRDHTACGTPSGISLAFITPVSVWVKWDKTDGAVSYMLQYRQIGTASWNQNTVPSDSFSIRGLKPATDYECQVSARCAIGPSAYSTSSTFKTDTITYKINIPNSFSPNGDGINDKFVVSGNDLESAALKVYDRWGTKVYDSGTRLGSWDGTYMGNPQPAGTYIYIAQLLFIDGKTETKTSTLTLIR